MCCHLLRSVCSSCNKLHLGPRSVSYWLFQALLLPPRLCTSFTRIIVSSWWCVLFVYRIPPNRVLPFGTRDNFWEMGEWGEGGGCNVCCLMYTCTFTCIQTCACIHAHTYKHMHTHMHMHVDFVYHMYFSHARMHMHTNMCTPTFTCMLILFLHTCMHTPY